MKTTKQFFTYLTLVLLTAVTLFAQAPKKLNNIKEDHISNLVNGIKSNNDGLKRSAVYLAGKYGVVETSDALVERLNSEKNPQDRILIALALYRIGNQDAYEAIKELAKDDYNPKVRRISNAICDAFEVEYEKLIVNLN